MLRLKLNAARSGTLYHFTESLPIVESILENGLRTSTEYESHMRDIKGNPKIKNKMSKTYAENPEMAFVSLTRSPSIIPRQGAGNNAWRYGVIFSADRLSDIAKILPYQYDTSHHPISITVNELEDDPRGFMYSTDISPDDIEVHSKGDDSPLDDFLDVFYELSDNPPPGFTFDEQQGEWTIQGELTSDYSFNDLPPMLQRMLTSTGFEAEERAFFPNAQTKEYIDATKKAIIGLVVPDTEYNSEEVQSLAQKYSYPVYVYRDPKQPLPEGESVPKEAYRQPTA